MTATKKKLKVSGKNGVASPVEQPNLNEYNIVLFPAI